MHTKARTKLGKLWRGFATTNTEIAMSSPTLEDMLEDARRQLYTAREYFQNVSDPELVDFAIKSLDLAECRYDYLYKLARNR